jgi:hypothetical protein
VKICLNKKSSNFLILSLNFPCSLPGKSTNEEAENLILHNQEVQTQQTPLKINFKDISLYMSVCLPTDCREDCTTYTAVYPSNDPLVT